MKDISIIIVTYNSAGDIKRCLDSLLSETSTENEIIVVDNASQDNTRELLNQYKDKIRVIYNRANLGYAHANNIGFKNAKGKYIFLLNPDAMVDSNSLKEMFDFMGRNNEVVALGPLVLNPDGSIQSSIRRFPNYRILFFELTGLSRLFPSSRIFNRWRMPDFDYKEIKDIEQPMAAALFLRRDFFKGQFMDNRFPIFFNDVDLCYRIWRRGGRLVFFPEASVIHKRGISTGKVKEKMIPLHTKGFLRFLLKHKRTLKARILFFLFLPWLMFNTILRILLLRFFNKDF